MGRLASIEKIHSIQPHPNEEVLKLEVGKIKEWPVVIPKGQYKNGDNVVFIQIDSIVPEGNPYFEFMRKQKFRVWNARFKGAPSQGLVCPISLITDKYLGAVTISEGDDVTDILNVTKYEKPLDTSINGDAKGGFPTHLVPVTDEDNLLNFPETLTEFAGEECYITIKADGSSMTVIYFDGEVRVCSRRLEQKETGGMWKIVQQYDLPNKLKTYGKNIAIQAEACGGRIQGNPMGLNKLSMFVFNVRDLATGKWCGWEEIKQICSDLGIPTVPLMHQPFLFDDTCTVKRLQDIANIAKYTSSTGEIKIAEGIVLRPMKPKYSSILNKPLSVKILNQEY